METCSKVSMETFHVVSMEMCSIVSMETCSMVPMETLSDDFHYSTHHLPHAPSTYLTLNPPPSPHT